MLAVKSTAGLRPAGTAEGGCPYVNHPFKYGSSSRNAGAPDERSSS